MCWQNKDRRAGGGGDLKLARWPPDGFSSFHPNLHPTLSSQIFSSLTWHLFLFNFYKFIPVWAAKYQYRIFEYFFCDLHRDIKNTGIILNNDSLVGSFLKMVSQEATSDTCMTNNNYKLEIKFIQKTTQNNK